MGWRHRPEEMGHTLSGLFQTVGAGVVPVA
jgi:hypothetical protein